MAEVSGDAAQLVASRLLETIRIKQSMLDSACIDQAVTVAAAIVASLRSGGRVLFFGNGGSSIDAGHLAAELSGRYYRDRPALAGISLSDSTAAMTAIANDYTYDNVFARQVQALGRLGDVAMGLTTSGNSRNVVEALKAAAEIGMYTVALTGLAGGKVADAALICIRVPSDDTPRIQEACMHLGHTICELVEQEMFPDA